MKILISLMILFSVHTAGASIIIQQIDPASTARYVEGLLKVDQQQLNLTAEQTDKAKAALADYMAKYNALPKSDLTKYKASLKELDIARVHQYKSFLTADQYSKLVARYNKYHPTAQIQ